MKRVDLYDTRVTFDGENGEKLDVSYDNRGEPYRQGVSFYFEDGRDSIALFLERREVAALRDTLTKILDGSV